MVRTMLAHELLGVPSLTFVEPDYASMPDICYNQVIAGLDGDEGRLLIDEEDNPLALAIGNRDAWTAASFHLRRPDVSVLERFESLSGEIWQESRGVWESAVREHFSSFIRENVPPSIEDCNPERATSVLELLMKECDGLEPGACLDFCCGSGIASAALRNLGFSPVSFDNDPGLLSRGFASHRLEPASTLCIDARIAPSYVNPVIFSVGLMFGEITSFNEDIWGPIVTSMARLTENGLISTGTQKEAEFVARKVDETGKKTRMYENDRDPVYDRWVCLISG